MFSFLFDLIAQIIYSVILLPIILIVSTPIIFLISFSGQQKYFENLKLNYKKVIQWWHKWV